jgi:elongator complex protein 2
VVDACWAADGGCLLTVSTDQTARITTRLADGHWCEIARPQVHGHDFSAVAALPCAAPATRDGDAPEQSGGAGQGTPAPRYLYASGSEEKVVRVFEAPRAFLHTLASARGTPVSSSAAAAAAALGAALPALGLSNKAVYQQDEEAEAAAAGSGSGGLAGVGAEAYAGGPDLAPNAAPSAVAGPPLEEHLAQNTLWPEVHKLYGHGNELYCLAADPRGAYLASACRAQAGDAAAVWLWDTRTWTAAAQLAAHTLTGVCFVCVCVGRGKGGPGGGGGGRPCLACCPNCASKPLPCGLRTERDVPSPSPLAVTQLAFSPDGRLLASASRDRSVALFARQPAGAPQPFCLLGRLRAHSRIVWGLHWSPDSALLATASRDGKGGWRGGGLDVRIFGGLCCFRLLLLPV